MIRGILAGPLLLLVAALLGVVQAVAPLGATALAAPTEQAAPGPFVKQAFDVLMDRFVTPLSSATILNGGWDGGVAFVREKAGADVGDPRPSLTGNRENDWRAFLDGYPLLVAAAAGTDQVELDRAIVAAMARVVDSNDTFFVPPGRGIIAQASEEYAGVGMNLNRDLIVTEVFEGSAAAAGGVRPGDRLTAVDGLSVEGMTSMHTSERVRGPIGTPVQVTLNRSGAPLTLSLTRATVALEWIAARMHDDAVGYMRIRRWPSPDALGTFQEALAVFEQGNARGLVIDVRGTAGGPFQTFVEVASHLMHQGPLYRERQRDGREQVISAKGTFWGRDVPIAVLVDQGSRSHSELLAQSLRENSGSYIVGTTTAGAVTGGNSFPLADGSTLAVTTREVTSGQGAMLNKVGVEPDQVVELDPAALTEGRDTQLEAALAYLRGQLGR